MRFLDIIGDSDLTPCPLCIRLTFHGEVCLECLKAIAIDESKTGNHDEEIVTIPTVVWDRSS